MRAIGVCTCVAVASAVSCTVLVPLDGLSGGAGPDAAVDTSVAPIHGPAEAALEPSPEGGGEGLDGGDAMSALDGADAAPDLDAAVPTADAGDAAAPDDASTGDDPCAAAILCDGFEQGLRIGLWPTQTHTGGAVSVDTVHAHSGSNALHVHLDADAGVTANVGISNSATIPSDYFVRTFIYAASPVDPVSHNLVITTQAEAPFWGTSLGTNFDGTLAVTNWTTSTSSYLPSSNPLPVDQWVCLEWEKLTSGSLESVNVWMNGVPVTSLSQDNLAGTVYDVTFLGAAFYQQPDVPASDTWYDDVVFAAAYIPCSP